MMKRVLGAAGVGVLISGLGALTACGGPSDEENTKTGAAALQSANVSIDLFDANALPEPAKTGFDRHRGGSFPLANALPPMAKAEDYVDFLMRG